MIDGDLRFVVCVGVRRVGIVDRFAGAELVVPLPDLVVGFGLDVVDATLAGPLPEDFRAGRDDERDLRSPSDGFIGGLGAPAGAWPRWLPPGISALLSAVRWSSDAS